MFYVSDQRREGPEELQKTGLRKQEWKNEEWKNGRA
jgi:hypothetical protein